MNINISNLDNSNLTEQNPFYFFKKEYEVSMNFSVDEFIRMTYHYNNAKYMQLYYIIITDILKLETIEFSAIPNILENIKKQLALFSDPNYLCSISVTSIISKQFLKHFFNLDSQERNEILNKLVPDTNINNFNTSESFITMDDNDYKSISTESSIYIKCDNTYEHLRLYIYESGLVIDFNTRKFQHYIRHSSDNAFEFIKSYILDCVIKNNFYDKYFDEYADNHTTQSVIIDNKEYKINYKTYSIILLLLNHLENLKPRTFFLLYFDYENTTNPALFNNLFPKSKNFYFKHDEAILDDSAEMMGKTDGYVLYTIGRHLETKKSYDSALQYYEQAINYNYTSDAQTRIDNINEEKRKLAEKEKIKKERKSLITKIKKRSSKPCLKMKFVNCDNIDIRDSKLGGIPYLPVGEKYPVDKNNEPIPLFFQVNFKDVKLDGFPTSGIFQFYRGTNDSAIRFYKDTSLESQILEPVTKHSYVEKNKKIIFQESKVYLSSLIYGKFEYLKKFFTEKDMNPEEYDSYDEFIDYLSDLLYEIDYSTGWTVGGYPLANDESDANSEYHSNYECLFVLDNLEYDTYPFILSDLNESICIDKEDLKNGNLDKAYLY